jgi:hypothetical protein
VRCEEGEGRCEVCGARCEVCSVLLAGRIMSRLLHFFFKCAVLCSCVKLCHFYFSA